MVGHSRFDAAEYLKNEAMIAEMLRLAAERNDEAHYANCLMEALRARTINQLAQETGLGREAILKLFSGGEMPAKSTLDIVAKAILAPMTQSVG